MVVKNSYCRLDGRWLWVRPPQFPSQECKEIGGRWNAAQREWRFPARIAYLEALREVYPELNLDLPDTELEPNTRWAIQRTHDGPAWLEHSLDRLREYQKDALAFLLGAREGALLALEMRLGKTVVALLAASMLEAQRVLVVTGKTLMRNWDVMAQEWIGRELSVVYKRDPNEDETWCVTSYDMLLRRRAAFCKAWDIVIFDESVLLKSRDSKRVGAARAVRKQAGLCWLLSGSPTTRYADDLWAQFNLIDPNGFPAYWRFAGRYCILDPVYGNPIATRPNRDVAYDHRDLMFVRSQRDVLPELPAVLTKTIMLDMNPFQQKTHDHMLNDFVVALNDGQVAAKNRIGQIQLLQRIASNVHNLGDEWPDDSVKADAIEELLENGEIALPAVIWTHWKPGALMLEHRLLKWTEAPRVAHINGDVPEQHRQNIVERFRNGEYDVLISGIGVGKFGLSLVGARTVVYLDRTFHADDFIQSLARTQHIESDLRVTCLTLLCAGSADELVTLNLEGKLPDIARISNADLVTLLGALGASPQP